MSNVPRIGCSAIVPSCSPNSAAPLCTSKTSHRTTPGFWAALPFLGAQQLFGSDSVRRSKPGPLSQCARVCVCVHCNHTFLMHTVERMQASAHVCVCACMCVCVRAAGCSQKLGLARVPPILPP